MIKTPDGRQGYAMKHGVTVIPAQSRVNVILLLCALDGDSWLDI